MWTHGPLRGCEERVLGLWGLPSKTHSPSLMVFTQIQLTDPTKYLTGTPQNCQGHSKQGKSKRNCHSQEQPKERLDD